MVREADAYPWHFIDPYAQYRAPSPQLEYSPWELQVASHELLEDMIAHEVHRVAVATVLDESIEDKAAFARVLTQQHSLNRQIEAGRREFDEDVRPPAGPQFPPLRAPRHIRVPRAAGGQTAGEDHRGGAAAAPGRPTGPGVGARGRQARERRGGRRCGGGGGGG